MCDVQLPALRTSKRSWIHPDLARAHSQQGASTLLHAARKDWPAPQPGLPSLLTEMAAGKTAKSQRDAMVNSWKARTQREVPEALSTLLAKEAKVRADTRRYAQITAGLRANREALAEERELLQAAELERAKEATQRAEKAAAEKERMAKAAKERAENAAAEKAEKERVEKAAEERAAKAAAEKATKEPAAKAAPEKTASKDSAVGGKAETAEEDGEEATALRGKRTAVLTGSRARYDRATGGPQAARGAVCPSEVHAVDVKVRAAIRSGALPQSSVEKLTDALLALVSTTGAPDARSRAACQLRALFAWIALSIDYDHAGRDAGNSETSPAAVIRSGKTICQGYADLLAAMAKRAGLTVAVVAGQSKGAGYVLGQTTFTDRSKHAWNKVELAPGEWYFCDACWAAQEGPRDGTRAIEDGYWLAPAHHFILDHFPNEPKDQLLKPPWSMGEFAKFVKLAPAFFKMQLQLSCRTVQLDARGGPEQCVTLTGAADLEVSARLELLSSDKTMEGRSFVQSDGGAIAVWARPPQPMQYKLLIFAGHAHVMSYLVEARAPLTPLGDFARTYAAAGRAGVTLREPTDACLPTGGKRFCVAVPAECSDAAVITADGEWHHLSKKQGVYEGTVALVPGDVKLVAKFQAGGSSFDTLAAYKCE